MKDPAPPARHERRKGKRELSALVEIGTAPIGGAAPAELPSDAALVRAAARGSADAFATLVSRYTRLVFAVCLGLLNDPDDSEDAVQDVFLKAMTRLGELREPERFAAWVASTARNHCLDLIKKKRRRLDLLRKRPEPAPAPDGHDDLRAALGRLPEGQRVPLLLFYFEGHSVRSVAEALGLSVGGACTRLCRARRRLRELLEEGPR